MDQTLVRLPILPLRPGIPEKQTHDHKRNGTTTLFAALEIATGQVTDRCFQQHTNREFLTFLKLSRGESLRLAPPTALPTRAEGKEILASLLTLCRLDSLAGATREDCRRDSDDGLDYGWYIAF